MKKCNGLRFKEIENHPWDVSIYSIETGWFGGQDEMFVASVDHSRKEIRPAHGYYAPQKTGKKIKRYAERIGYTWKQ